MGISMQNYGWALTAIITLFCVLAVHRLAEKRNKAIEFRAVSKQFRDSVLKELKDVYPVATNWPDHIGIFLTNKFISLQQAVTTFESALPFYKLLFFRRAWRICCVSKSPTNKKITQEYHQYMGVTINGHNVDPQKQLKKNIDRLLKYAKT